MRPVQLLREALAVLWNSKLSAAVIAVVTAITCSISLLTVGQTAVTLDRVTRQLEEVGSRSMSVVDARGEGFIDAATVKVISRLSGVEEALALAAPVDVTATALGAGGAKAPLFQWFGPELPGMLTWGRWPATADEAVATRSALSMLGLDQAIGSVDLPSGRQVSVVGEFTPPPGLPDLENALLAPLEEGKPARELHVQLISAGEARTTVPRVLEVLAPKDTNGTYVSSPLGMAATAQQLSATLARDGSTRLLAFLGAGALFVGSVVLADVLLRRRDLGRRRTLGMTRADIVTLVALRAGMAALLGAFVGCAGSSWASWQFLHTVVPFDYVVAVGVLALLTAVAAAIPPGAYAAMQDPVRVLRSP